MQSCPYIIAITSLTEPLLVHFARLFSSEIIYLCVDNRCTHFNTIMDIPLISIIKGLRQVATVKSGLHYTLMTK